MPASRYLFFPTNDLATQTLDGIRACPEYNPAYTAVGNTPYGTRYHYFGVYWSWFHESLAPAVERVSGMVFNRRWVPRSDAHYVFGSLEGFDHARVDGAPKVLIAKPLRPGVPADDQLIRVCSETLGPYTDRNIVIEVPPKGCHCPDLSDRGYLRLVVNGGPENRLHSYDSRPTHLDGTAVPSREYWPQESGKGIPIAVEGHVIGELFGEHTLFIFPDIVSTTSEVTCKLLAFALTAAAEHFPLRNCEPAERVARAKERTKRAFGAIASAQISPRVRELEREIAAIKKDTDRLGAELAVKVREARAKQAEMIANNRPLEEVIEFGAKEYDRLIEHPLIESVNAQGSILVVDTRTIVIKDVRTGSWHEVGRFRLTFKVVDDVVTYNFVNKDRRIQSQTVNLLMHHPHVHGAEGIPCLGTIKESFPALLSRREFAAAIYLAIDFLCSADVYETNGTGHELKRFPVYVPPPETRSATEPLERGSGEVANTLSVLTQV